MHFKFSGYLNWLLSYTVSKVHKKSPFLGGFGPKVHGLKKKLKKKYIFHLVWTQ